MIARVVVFCLALGAITCASGMCPGQEVPSFLTASATQVEQATVAADSSWDYYLDRVRRVYDQAAIKGGEAWKEFEDWAETNPTMRQVQDLYEKAKEEGETAADNVYDWTREDLNRFGRWEYRVVTVESMDADLLESHLNRLGSDRWECFHAHAEPVRAQFTLFLKRLRRSYLRSIPAVDLLKLIPPGVGETESDTPSN